MDNVSNLADKSNHFSNFLTVSRKFGYICLYIFHVIYPTKSIWQMILSQTKIFNIFPSSIQLGNMLKILTNNCDRETIKYILARDLWINRLYFSLSNESKNSCLIIDCRKSGPAKYRTHTDNNFDQICYYGQNKKDKLLNKFSAKRMQQNNPVGTRYCGDICFLLNLHRDIDQLHIEIEVTSLYDIFFQHHNDVVAIT